MEQQGAYGRQLGSAFRMADAPTLASRILQKSTVALTELRCDQPKFGLTAPMAREDAYLIALQLRACPNHDLYFDGRMTRPQNYVEGVTSIYDLRLSPVADIRDPFHCLMFYLPQTALHSLAIENSTNRPRELRHRLGVSVDDPTVRHLLSALLPAMAKPEETNSLFLDHVALALTIHIASVYGGMNGRAGGRRGGLAPWQERRAKELMRECLDEEISLSWLASECNLSVRQFARAFRMAAGVPPHRWLVQTRVQQAKELLSKRALSLADVAAFCGFADQSHFTRVFTQMVGVPPGEWRRLNSIPPHVSDQSIAKSHKRT